MNVLSKPLLLLFFILSSYVITFAQPTVTNFTLTKGGFNYVTSAITANTTAAEVPLNDFVITTTFDERIRSADDQDINDVNRGGKMWGLFLGSDTSNDLFTGSGPPTLNITDAEVTSADDAGGNPDRVITIRVRLFQDLIPGQTYTLQLAASQAQSAAGDDAEPFEVVFTTASAPNITIGDASGSQMCNTDVVEVPPIFISEVSNHTFARNTTGALTLIFEGNDPDFQFVTTSGTVTMVGANGTTATKGTVSTTEFPINYSIADNDAEIHTLIITGLKVRYVGNATKSINIIAKDNDDRYNINGLYSSGRSGTNAPVALARVAGATSIADAALNPTDVSGNANLCLSSGSSDYIVSTVTGASHYLWTIPASHFDVTNADNISGEVWRTTTNQITLTPKAIGNPTVRVTGLNNCRVGTATVDLPVSITENLLITDGSMDASTILGSTSICNGSSSERYTVAPVSTAAHYEWTVPANFTVDVSNGAVGLGGNVFQTTNNFIDLTPNTATTTPISLSVIATNGCLRGQNAGNSAAITIHTITIPRAGEFNTTATGNFGPGETINIADNAGDQIITVNTGGALATFSGTGIGGADNNEFYPNVVGKGNTSEVTYTYTDGNGCVNTGTFTFSVFDADATISGVLDYCDNDASNPQFRVKLDARGTSIPANFVLLSRVTPTTGSIAKGPDTGFDIIGDDGTDHIIELDPTILGAGTYRITAFTTGFTATFTKEFTINEAPVPSFVTSPTSACANESSTFEVNAVANRTYTWTVSGGGSIAGASNGSSVTIDWLPATTNAQYEVTVTETNTSTGCKASATVTIDVFGQPTAVINANSNSFVVCAGSTESYTANLNTKYLWFVDDAEGDIVTSPTEQEVQVQWKTGITEGTIVLTTTNGNGCQTTVRRTVTISTPPVPTFQAETSTENLSSVCVLSTGNVYTLNISDVDHTITWEVTGGTIQETNGTTTWSGKGTRFHRATIDWGNATSGKIRIIQTDDEEPNCEGEVTYDVTLNPLPTLVISGLTSKYCAESSTVTLVATANGVEVTNFGTGSTNQGLFFITDESNTNTLLTLTENTFDPNDAALGIGKYNLVFTYTDDQGCVKITDPSPFEVQVKPIVVINSTTSTITGNVGETCARATHTYTVDGGVVAGNTYSWSVTGGIIINEAADKSQIEVTWGTLASGTVTLTETNASSCVASETVNVTINALPEPTFATSETSACVTSTNQIYTINPVTDAHTITWEVVGGTIQGGTNINNVSTIVQPNLESITVDWGNGAQGTITVTETDGKNCAGSISRIITLTPLPALTFTGINTTYCENDADIILSPAVNGAGPSNPNNGVFLVRDATNTNVIMNLGAGNNTLVLSDVVAAGGTGDYTLVYQFTDSERCFNESSPVSFTVNPTPKNIRVSVKKRFDSRDVIFSATTDGTTTGLEYDWIILGVTKNQQTDTLTLSSDIAQSIPYTLVVTNGSGCQVSLSKVFKIDYSFVGQCLGTATQFTDATSLGTDAVESWNWDFGDGNTSTDQNPGHVYAREGTYFVTLTVTEGVSSYSLTKRIDIFPVVTLTPTKTYSEDYTNGAEGWISHGVVDSSGIALDRTSWQLKTPGGFGNIPNDKGNGWVTDNTGSTVATTDAKYNANEQSYVESPCFDITALNRPMVSFNYFSDTDNGSDGVVLLYTIDDGLTWFRVGAENQGLEWYDTKPVLGQPGSNFTSDNADNQGWSGNTQALAATKTWKTARFGLDEILQAMNNAGITANKIVRFRVAFGSNSDNSPNQQYDGFAFDDFQISSRNRLVLTEYFINQVADPEGALDAAANTFAATKAETINIHYHTDFPGVDAINNQSANDVSGRSFHYGIRDVPRIVVDGVTRDEVPVLTTGDANNWADSTFSTRTLINAPFLINISNPEAAGGTLSVNVTINAIEAVTGATVIHLVVIDSTVNLDGVTYYNAVRKMLPDAAGTFHSSDWVQGSSETFTYTWDYGAQGLDPSRFRIVAFVAAYDSNEILQAEVSSVQGTRTGKGSDIDAITSIAEDLKSTNVKVYPNPATHHLNVSLQNKGLSANAQWEIVSINGQLMKRGLWNRGYQQIQLDINDLAEGIYLLRVYNDKTTFQRRFEKH